MNAKTYIPEIPCKNCKTAMHGVNYQTETTTKMGII